MTQVSPSTARATRSLKTSTGTSVQFGPHASTSSSTKGTPSRRASSRANVVLPEPVDPTMEMRRLTRSGWRRRGRRLGGDDLCLFDLVVLVAAPALTPQRFDLLDQVVDDLVIGRTARCRRD